MTTAQRDKKEEREKNKKKAKKRKRSAQKTKSKKNNFFPTFCRTLPRPPSFPKGPEGCPLNHRRVRIQAFQRDTYLLSTHIRSWSNIELEQVTKNGYYNGYYGTTPVVPCPGAQMNPIHVQRTLARSQYIYYKVIGCNRFTCVF